MSIQTNRIATVVPITGATQSANTAQSIMGKIDQIIVTSDQSSHTFELELRNANGDIILERRAMDTLESNIRPDLLPGGVVTIYIYDPVPGSGNVTVVFVEKQWD